MSDETGRVYGHEDEGVRGDIDAEDEVGTEGRHADKRDGSGHGRVIPLRPYAERTSDRQEPQRRVEGVPVPSHRASEALDRVRASAEGSRLHKGGGMDEDTALLEAVSHAVSAHLEYRSQLGADSESDGGQRQGVASTEYRRIELPVPKPRLRHRYPGAWAVGVGSISAAFVIVVFLLTVFIMQEMSMDAPVRSVVPGSDTACTATVRSDGTGWEWSCPSLQDSLDDRRTIGQLPAK